METQSILKRKYKIKADNDKKEIDLKKVKVNADDDDDDKINIKHEGGSFKVDIKDKKLKVKKNVIILGKKPLHLRDKRNRDAKSKKKAFVRQQPMHPQ